MAYSGTFYTKTYGIPADSWLTYGRLYNIVRFYCREGMLSVSQAERLQGKIIDNWDASWNTSEEEAIEGGKYLIGLLKEYIERVTAADVLPGEAA